MPDYIRPMDSFTINKAGKVEFFGMTTATPDFLLKHGVSYAHQGHSLDVIVETRQDGTPLMYLLADNQQLRVVTLPELSKRYAHLDGKPESAKKRALTVIADEHSHSELGELLYLAHYEDVDSQAPLLNAAYNAAKGAGVTHATARWFGQSFVQDAFFGYGEDQEFTDQGVFRGPAAFDSTPATVKQQLKRLQQAGIMAYEALPKEAGFYLRFNRQSLPIINQEKLPRFFDTFMY